MSKLSINQLLTVQEHGVGLRLEDEQRLVVKFRQFQDYVARHADAEGADLLDSCDAPGVEP